MFNCSVQCYAWDLVDEGIPAVLDRLYGQLGATGLVLVVACDATRQLRPHDVEPRIHQDDGGVYFQPAAEHYVSTRLKPPVWTAHRKLDVLAAVSEGCAERQLDLRLALWPLASRRLVHKHPEVAQKNIFGWSSLQALCPHNPDVEAYLIDLVGDLSVYDDVSGLILHDMLEPRATDPDVRLGQIGAVAPVRELLAMCFCESCLQRAERADIDVLAARRGVRAAVDHACTHGTALGELDRHEPLQRYRALFDSGIDRLLERIRQAAAKPLTLALTGSERSAIDPQRPFPPPGIARVCLDDMPGDTWSTAHPDRVELCIAFDAPALPDAQLVVQTLTAAAERGLAGVVVGHYGAVLDDQLEWLHQGVRNARRLSARA